MASEVLVPMFSILAFVAYYPIDTKEQASANYYLAVLVFGQATPIPVFYSHLSVVVLHNWYSVLHVAYYFRQRHKPRCTSMDQPGSAMRQRTAL